MLCDLGHGFESLSFISLSQSLSLDRVSLNWSIEEVQHY